MVIAPSPGFMGEILDFSPQWGARTIALRVMPRYNTSTVNNAF
jgi:hypothetical protein